MKIGFGGPSFVISTPMRPEKWEKWRTVFLDVPLIWVSPINVYHKGDSVMITVGRIDPETRVGTVQSVKKVIDKPRFGTLALE